VLRTIVVILFSLGIAAAQQQPQVKVNMLNVCSPSQEEQQEIAAALAKVPRQPLFSPDFEVARGRTSMEERPSFLQAGSSVQFSSDTPVATWVRIRQEFSVQAMFSTVQYSFSMDPKTMMETMVFRVRDPKDLMQLAIEDSASAVTLPSAMLGTSTPASRIKLERFGKSSVVLARCEPSENAPAPDQSAYEPLFKSASAIIENYRGLLGVKRTVPEELSKIEGHSAPAKTKHIAKPAAK
jgi:hypothetical protein